jgi:hypothetical protein
MVAYLASTSIRSSFAGSAVLKKYGRQSARNGGMRLRKETSIQRPYCAVLVARKKRKERRSPAVFTWKG